MISSKSIKLLRVLFVSGLVFSGLRLLNAQGPDDYFVGHGFVGNGDTVYTSSGTFWDDGYTANYSPTGNWNVYFCTPAGNPNPLTLEFSGFATHYGGAFPISFPGEYLAWDYMRIRYSPATDYYCYHDDTPEFSFTAEDGCIHVNMVKNGDAFTQSGWEAEIYAIPPPPNNDPCGAANLTVGNSCSPQVFSNKGAYSTGTYASPCHTYFGGDVWFSAVVPASGNLKIESFPGTLKWAVMNIYTGNSCSGLTHYACIEDSIGMPTAQLSGLTPGDTMFIRMFGDQAKSGTFGMCASDPTAQITGYTGPGGVGDDSTNVIWLRADLGVLNNSDLAASSGEAVKTWGDRSGNSNDVTQTTGSMQPLLTGNVINGMPVVRMDGTDDYLSAELSTLSAPLALIAVGRFTASASDDYLVSIGDEISTIKTVSISRENDDRYYSYTDGAKWYGPTLNDNTPYLIHAVHNTGIGYHELYINEAAQSPADYTTPVVTNGSLCLGASRDITNFLGGDIAEFIIYKQKLNTAQKIIVENSLAAKYGISIATDRYEWEATHPYDVAGIGQVDAGNRHTLAQSASTLSIGNPTDLDDGEFVLFGHDNGDIGTWTTTERPGDDPDLMRIAREWRISISGGDPGSLTISLSDSLLPALVPGFNNYILFTDADGDFTTGATPVPLVRVDGEYIANSVNLANGTCLTVGTVMPVAGFSQDSSAGSEAIPNPAIEVRLNYALNEEASVVFRAIDGTAAGGGVDYLLNPGTATFPAGTTTTYIQPAIINDTIVELPDEYFEIRLSDPDPGLLISADSIHTYTILNDDLDVSAGTDTDTIGECGLVSANLSVTVNGTGPFVYAWTPAGGLSDDSILNPVATPASDTWYVITVTDQTNWAVGTDSVHISVIPKPAKPLITPGGATTFCEGDSVLLSATAGFSWLWSDGRSTQDIYASAAGNYTVRIIDEFGCQSDPSDPETVTVNAIPATPLVTASDPLDFCPGDSVDLTSSDGDQYLWSTAETAKTIRLKTAGDYYVQVRSTGGCWSDTSLVTTVTLKTPPAAPTITASGPVDFCPGDSVDLASSAGDTWLWSTGETTQTIRVKTAGSFSVQVTDATTCLSDPSASSNVTLYPEPGPPVITPGGSTDICETDSVSLGSSAGSGWLWSDGETTQLIYAKVAGDYTVRVSNAEGCWSVPSPATAVTTQPAPAKPLISYSGNTNFCEGDSLVLNSSAGTSYLWSGGETTQSVSIKQNGSWWVRVSDASGCFSVPSDPVSTIVNPLPGSPVITGDSEYCAGNSVQLSAPAADSWLWSTGETTASINVTAGSYTLIIRDATGCESPPSAPHDVTENPLPARPVITGNSSYCEGDSVLLSTGPASAYSWSTGETTPDIHVRAGSYTVLVSDAKECWSPASDPYPVTELPRPAKPVITADGPLDIWAGDSVILSSSSAASYLWSPNGESTQDILIMAAGDYSVIITGANGCPGDPSDPVTVTVLSIEKPVITVSGETEFCEGSSQTLLSAPDAFAWEWSTGETTQDITVTSGGSYTVRVWNEGEQASEVSDPVTVIVHANPAVSLAGKTDVTCHGESTGSAEVTVTGGTGPFAYAWSGGQTGAQVDGLSAGTHTVTVTDANQCLGNLDVGILEPPAITITETISHPYCPDSHDGSIGISISGGTPSYSILWSDGSSGTALLGLDPGTVNVEITDASQCTAFESYTLNIQEDNCVRIPGIITPNNDGFNDSWRIPGIEFYPGATVEVYDRWGKQVFYSTGYDQPWDGTYDGKLLPMDSYHYVINLHNGSPALIGNITIIK
jgi:gliding motility-associated-like protein